MTSFNTSDFGLNAIDEARSSGRVDGLTGKGGKGSWLEAVAAAMGTVQGKLAFNMMEKLDALNGLAKGAAAKDPGAAEAFQTAMSEFQSVSQLFNMVAQANSTTLKAIGEGMGALARKS